MPKEYTESQLIDLMQNEILGKWHDEGREGNDGSAGNTLEDLLEVEENNFKLPDWGDIELKTKRLESKSLVTLLHREPMPNASVPKLLTALGWRHQQAGIKYPKTEMSFRSTTRANDFSVRGFSVNLTDTRIEFVFDPNQVARDKVDVTHIYPTYGDWLDDVLSRAKGEPQSLFPIYWERDYIEKEIITKLDKTLYVTCKTRKKDGVKQFMYVDAVLLSGFNHKKMGEFFDEHALYVDFDARTNHNHGTKFRVNVKNLGELFEHSVMISER